jgi:hypothetical protein
MKKLVRESLNEISLDGSHLDRMNIGMKSMIKQWLEEMEIMKYVINDNFTIRTTGIIDLDSKGLIQFPSFIKFEETGDFFCSKNSLISLRGCPDKVIGEFSCAMNRLTSLEGCPKKVSGSFYCYGNNKKFKNSYIRNLCDVGGHILE